MVFPPSDDSFGYVLLFVNVSSPSQVFASSEQFAIEGAGIDSLLLTDLARPDAFLPFSPGDEAENNTSTSPSSPTTSYVIYPSQVALPASISPSPVSSS